MENIREALQWRYATKKMNGQTVEADKIEAILDAVYYAPSSSGLMPYKVIVVADPELKEKIRPVAFNQSQITDASHLLIFASWDKVTPERIDAAFRRMNNQRGLDEAATADYVAGLKTNFGTVSESEQQAFAAKQSYIGLGFALLTAAQLKVDTTPMEGFNKEQLDALLGLSEDGLKSQSMLAIGYRDASNDWLVNMKKVRPEREDFFIKK